jgi:hypothetical protein
MEGGGDTFFNSSHGNDAMFELFHNTSTHNDVLKKKENFRIEKKSCFYSF